VSAKWYFSSPTASCIKNGPVNTSFPSTISQKYTRSPGWSSDSEGYYNASRSVLGQMPERKYRTSFVEGGHRISYTCGVLALLHPGSECRMWRWRLQFIRQHFELLYILTIAAVAYLIFLTVATYVDRLSCASIHLWMGRCISGNRGHFCRQVSMRFITETWSRFKKAHEWEKEYKYCAGRLMQCSACVLRNCLAAKYRSVYVYEVCSAWTLPRVQFSALLSNTDPVACLSTSQSQNTK
jgi:hypothetical protein